MNMFPSDAADVAARSQVGDGACHVIWDGLFLDNYFLKDRGIAHCASLNKCFYADGLMARQSANCSSCLQRRQLMIYFGRGW